ncbi:MAG: P-loop NTPase [Candidatus Aenigmatarchaeota archaeon]
MARIIGVVSGKGGVGKSTVVSNLAVAFKQFGKNVTLIDCNITTPHLNFYLGSYDYSLSLNNVLRGDTTILSACYYHDGIFFVPASQEVKDIIGVNVMDLKNSLTELESSTDIILLDSAPSLGKEALSVLTASDEIIFVATPYMPSINDIIKYKQTIQNFNVKVLGIVLNMVRNDKSELKRREVENITGLPVIAEIPYDTNVLDALSKKVPILDYKPDSSASIEYKNLGAKLLGYTMVEARPKKMLFSRFYDILKNMLNINKIKIHENVKSPIYLSEIYNEHSIKTNADRIFDLVKSEKSIKITELAKRTNLTVAEVANWSKFLEERGLVEYQKSFLGEDRLRLKNA